MPFIVSVMRKVDRHYTTPVVVGLFDSYNKADNYISDYIDVHGDEPRCWFIDELDMNSSYVIEGE